MTGSPSKKRSNIQQPKSHIRREKSQILVALFIVGALYIICVPQSVLAFIPPQNGENTKTLHHAHEVRLSHKLNGRYRQEVIVNYTVSGGDMTRKKKRKNKYQKRAENLVPQLSGKEVTTKNNVKRRRQSDRHKDPRHHNHIAYLKMLDRHPTLVLNADYQPLSALPLSLWSWQDTVKSVFAGKVIVVDVYPNAIIRAVNMDMALPSVIALTDYATQPSQAPAFTRRNVFLRDGYRCQYCAKRHRVHELSLDHVVPRCIGGKLEWENVVTCCKKCNGQKGSCLPGDLCSVGMKLLRTPRTPTRYELASEATLPRRIHPTWTPFLGRILKPSRERN